MIELRKTFEPYRNVMLIFVGSAVYAFGLHYFVISNEFMEGGITGIALLLNYGLHIPLSITILVLNIPLFFIGWKVFGKQPMVYTILGTLSLSLFLWVMEQLIRYGWIIPFRTQQDYFLATLYAGVTLGTGSGIVFRFGGTTGGSDIIARLGNKWRGWSMGQVILAFDVIVIGLSLFYIPREKVLYTMVAVFISSRMIDFITEGAYTVKAFTIITEQAEPMVQFITKELQRGVTLFPSKGAYSQMHKDAVYCIVSRHEMRRLIVMIQSIDHNAFIVISDVHDVLGEGFRID